MTTSSKVFQLVQHNTLNAKLLYSDGQPLLSLSKTKVNLSLKKT